MTRLVAAAVAGLLAFLPVMILMRLLLGINDVADIVGGILAFLGVPVLVLRYWPESASPPSRESRFVVSAGLDGVSLTDPRGHAVHVPVQDLLAVDIETNDSGPWGTDLWWIVTGSGEGQRCLVPGGATGEQELVEWVTALPGADSGQIVAAMGCTSPARFRIWTRP